MLDLKWIRANPDAVREGLRRRGLTPEPLDELLAVDERRLGTLREVETLRARRNAASEEIGRRRRSGEAADELVAEMRELGERLGELERSLAADEETVRSLLLNLPNVPEPDVPDGPDAAANVEVRRWGEPSAPPGGSLPHWEVGARLGILDFERAGKISGSRFAVYRGAGARLVRSLVAFMLDLHTRRHGYTEVYPPFLVTSASMTATGHLPRFAGDAFAVRDADLWLVPTAEVPLVNLYRDEILPDWVLPVRHAAYTACFRSEAGAAGRDTRGLIRNHQFDKVELVWLTRPEESAEALEQITAHAEVVLRQLGLPHRVVALCAGDLGFWSAKTYDIEVWMPSYGRYVEISSCSNVRDYQARRANIRFRRADRRLDFVHTLNGSGVAVGRAVAAILENFQEPDGRVRVPDALRPYFGAEVIGPEG